MKSKALLLLLTPMVVMATMLTFITHEASAQQQTVFICNGVAQGSPNCAPPTPVLKNYIRVDRMFGALAYDEGKSIWYGSYQYPSKAEAQKGVLTNCRENGGNPCKLMLSYTNQCAAVARVSEHGAEIRGKDTVDTGSTQQEAEANARRSCQSDWGAASCAITLSNCSHHSVARWSQWVYDN